MRRWYDGAARLSKPAYVEGARGLVEDVDIARGLVPRISALGLLHLKGALRDASGIDEALKTNTVSGASDFTASWKSFLHGGVHSVDAARIIQTLLTMVACKYDKDEDDVQEADKSDQDEDTAPVH